MFEVILSLLCPALLALFCPLALCLCVPKSRDARNSLFDKLAFWKGPEGALCKHWNQELVFTAVFRSLDRINLLVA